MCMQDSQIEFKLLGIMFNKQLTWDGHVDYICKKKKKQDYIF